MKIKNLFIVLCLINLSSKAQVTFGINAGANMGNLVTKLDGKKDEGIKSSIGYIISADINVPVNEKLIFQTGLQYESIHNKVNTNNTSSGGGFTVKRTFDAKAHIGFINIPAKLFYKLPAGNGSILIGGGPFIGIGINGRSKSTDITETTIGASTTRSVYDYNEKVRFGNSDTTIKRLNAGVGINLCYVLANNLSFSLYSNLGLSNINNQDKYSTKTYAAGIKIGYIFAKKE